MPCLQLSLQLLMAIIRPLLYLVKGHSDLFAISTKPCPVGEGLALGRPARRSHPVGGVRHVPAALALHEQGLAVFAQKGVVNLGCGLHLVGLQFVDAEGILTAAHYNVKADGQKEAAS